MNATKAFGLHYGGVAAVACTAGLREEHVVIVILVVSSLEAISADGHARGSSAGATSVGDNVRHPDESAFCMVVVAPN